MNWIIGLQSALDFVEEHLTEEIDYDEVAAKAYSSSYHFQRVFSILCGYTLGEYIRRRRLTLAGAELASGDARVIDVALKYGYESPDSFAKAFKQFHGILPSQARGSGEVKSFSRLFLKLSLEGGNMMNYKLEEKPEMILTGYKKRFTGTPADRFEQERDFYVSTRVNQYLLKGLSRDVFTGYNVMTGFDNDGYDFYIASKLDEWTTENLGKTLGYAEEAGNFEKIVIPRGLYLICETERTNYPTMLFEELRRKAVSELLPSLGCQLTDSPEISVNHWFYEYGNTEFNHSRYIELWLPVTKLET